MKGLATAHDLAAAGKQWLEQGWTLPDLYRHVILQLLDNYNSAAKREGLESAATLFAQEPMPTGSSQLDAALAALAAHLAFRDHWEAPSWADDPKRYAQPWWFVSNLPTAMALSLRDSPIHFKTRGVFITKKGLERV